MTIQTASSIRVLILLTVSTPALGTWPSNHPAPGDAIILQESGEVQVTAYKGTAALTFDLWIAEPYEVLLFEDISEYPVASPLGYFDVNTELVFRLRVQHGAPDFDQYDLYTGPGTAYSEYPNPDGIPHAIADRDDTGVWIIGFEDLLARSDWPPDYDYDDFWIELQVNPEPAALWYIVLGGLGIRRLRRGRRRLRHLPGVLIRTGDRPAGRRLPARRLRRRRGRGPIRLRRPAALLQRPAGSRRPGLCRLSQERLHRGSRSAILKN